MHSKFSHWAIALITIFSFSSGCDSPITVEGTPRDSKQSPVFASDLANNKPQLIRDIIGLAQPNHNVCFRLNVPELINNPDLSEVDWNGLNESLETYVGKANADIKNLASMVVLADLKGTSLFTIGSGGSLPGIFVLEFINPIDASGMPAEIEQKKRRFSRKIVGRLIEEKFVLIGRPKDIDPIEFSSTTIANQVRKLSNNQQQVVSGVISFSSMQEQLDSIFKMVSGIPGLDMGKLASFPQFADRLEFQGSLDGKKVIDLRVFTDDVGLNEEIAKRIRGLVSDSKSAKSGGFGDVKMMLESSAAEISQKVMTEISEENLLQVQHDDKQATIALEKPQDMSRLIKSLVQDGIEQGRLTNRVVQLQSIAKGLEKWMNENESLITLFASSDADADSDDATGKPFNWRVALLPSMGQQELFDKFDFSQPWDSGTNLAIAKATNPFGGNDGETSIHRVAGTRAYDLSTESVEGEDPKWLLMEFGPEEMAFWTAPTKPVSVEDESLKKFGMPAEQGVLVVNQKLEVKAFSKQSPDEPVICPGIQQRTGGGGFEGFGF